MMERTIKRQSKYRARATVIDGIRFDSKAEARRWSELLLLQRANKIADLERQPVYPLHAPDGTKIGDYVADFRYFDFDRNEQIIEDVKSPASAKIPLYRWKKKHTEAEHKIKITEVI